MRLIRAVWRDIQKYNIFLIAAGISFFWLLAFVPAVTAIISLYGLFADPEHVKEFFSSLGQVFPETVREFLVDHVSRLSREAATAGIAAVSSTLFAFWIGFNAIKAVFKSLNIIHGVREDDRGFFLFQGQVLGFTMAMFTASLFSTFLIVVYPHLLDSLDLPGWLYWVLSIVRWFVLALMAMVGLAWLYRFGPNRSRADWQFASLGSLVATVTWIVVSVGFGVYVGNFQTYNRMYGSLGGFVAVLIWFFFSALIVLLGALINHELERIDE